MMSPSGDGKKAIAEKDVLSAVIPICFVVIVDIVCQPILINYLTFVVIQK